MFRFFSGLVVGVPIAVISYYSLPLLLADITVTHITLIGTTAGVLGALRPSLLLKGLACGFIWDKV